MKINLIHTHTFAGSTARCAGAHVTDLAMPGTDLSDTSGVTAAMA